MFRIEYLHHESSHWQGQDGFVSKDEAEQYIKAEGFDTFCEEILLWDEQGSAPDEYDFDTGRFL